MPMHNYRRFYRQWIDGRIDAGSHKKVRAIPRDGGGSTLVGYGHCVYAVRDADDNVTIYEGWADPELSTNASALHVNTLIQEAESHLPSFVQMFKLHQKDIRQKVDGSQYDRFNVDYDQGSVTAQTQSAQSQTQTAQSDDTQSDDTGGLGDLFTPAT